MAARLNQQQQMLSQILLFNGCLSASDIQTQFKPAQNQADNAMSEDSDDQDAIDIERMVNTINRWHESNHTGLTVESFEYIDSQIYYGWRTIISNDDVSKESMQALTRKQISFWKIFLNVTLQNYGISSLNSAFTLNRSGMLGIQNILSRSELMQLFKILVDMKYLKILDDQELENDDEYDENEDNRGENKYYMIGPRSFIDLKVWIESKTEHSGSECPLCSDYVMMKGFKCGNDRCPSVIHEQCIQNYFSGVQNGRYICPSCQNAVEIENMEDINDYIKVLSHPNNAIKIIEELKIKSRQEPKMETDESDEDEDKDQSSDDG